MHIALSLIIMINFKVYLDIKFLLDLDYLKILKITLFLNVQIL